MIAVIGEAPGRIEDATRKPFVGPSGKLAESWLERVGIDAESVAWLNAVSCFPNRSPTAREVLACKDNLLSQLQYLRPQFCLLFGGVALHAFWPSLRIGDMRGMWWQLDIEADYEPWGLATWHPAAVLRNKTKEVEVIADLTRFRTGHPVIKDRCVLCKDSPVTEWDKGGCVGWCTKHSPSLAGIRNKPTSKASKQASKRMRSSSLGSSSTTKRNGDPKSIPSTAELFK